MDYASNKDELIALIRKYKKTYTIIELDSLLNRKTYSVFCAVTGELPKEKKARKDADKMMELYWKLED